MKEIVDISKECMQTQTDEPCRYDHNRNCQEHSWFGLDGDDCPVEVYRQALEKIKELEK